MREPSRPRVLTIEEIEGYCGQRERANATARAEISKRGVTLNPRIKKMRDEAMHLAAEQLAKDAYYRSFCVWEAPRTPIIDAVTERPLNEPELLLSLDRHIQSVELLLIGLQQHYLDSVTMGRLDTWKKAGHAIIDLCGDVASQGKR